MSIRGKIARARVKVRQISRERSERKERKIASQTNKLRRQTESYEHKVAIQEEKARERAARERAKSKYIKAKQEARKHSKASKAVRIGQTGLKKTGRFLQKHTSVGKLKW